MELETALQKLQKQVTELGHRKNELSAQLEQVTREQAEASEQYATLQRILERFGETPAPAEVPPFWIGLRRQEAVFQAMREIGEPAHLKKIVDYLRGTGRPDDSVELVSAALSTLRSKGQVEPKGRGVWAIVMVPTGDTPSGLSHLFDGGGSP